MKSTRTGPRAPDAHEVVGADGGERVVSCHLPPTRQLEHLHGSELGLDLGLQALDYPVIQDAEAAWSVLTLLDQYTVLPFSRLWGPWIYAYIQHTQIG